LGALRSGTKRGGRARERSQTKPSWLTLLISERCAGYLENEAKWVMSLYFSRLRPRKGHFSEKMNAWRVPSLNGARKGKRSQTKPNGLIPFISERCTKYLENEANHLILFGFSGLRRKRGRFFGKMSAAKAAIYELRAKASQTEGHLAASISARGETGQAAYGWGTPGRARVSRPAPGVKN
jgi:hypothetical protein